MLPFLYGCQHSAIFEDFSSFESKKKGIVLFRMTQKMHKTDLKKSKNICTDKNGLHYLTYYLRRASDGKIVRKDHQYHSVPCYGTVGFWTYTIMRYYGDVNYDVDMLFLEPGLYFIERIDFAPIYYYGSIRSRSVGPPAYNKLGEITLGAFEVKAGEVIGLGDLQFYSPAGYEYTGKVLGPKLIREDKKMRKELIEAGHIDIANKLKPGVFYEPGSLFNTYKDKKGNMRWEIIPREEYEKSF